MPAHEDAIICAILMQNTLLSLAQSRNVTAASFTDTRAAKAYAEAQRQYVSEGKFDLITLGAALPDDMLYLAEASGATPTTANFTLHLDLVKRSEAARNLQKAAEKAKESLADGADVRLVAAELSEAASSASAAADGSQIPDIAELSSGIDRLLDSPMPCIPFFPLGTEGRYRIQFHPGEMMILGGGTGLGKTALACSAAVTQLEENLTIAYFCTESSGTDILARIVAASCGVSHFAVSANRQRRDLDRVSVFRAAKNRLIDRHGSRLYIFGCDSGRITPDFIESRLTIAENNSGKIDVVYIDFIQDVKPSAAVAKQQKAMQIEDTTSRIHDTLIRHRSAGVVLSQFNRTGTQQKDEYPDLSWLKDSSALEQLAHTVAFLYRRKVDAVNYAEDTEFFSAKTRNQPPFALTLDWNGTGYTSRHPQFVEQKSE